MCVGRLYQVEIAMDINELCQRVRLLISEFFEDHPTVNRETVRKAVLDR